MLKFGVVKLNDPIYDYLLIFLDIENFAEAIQEVENRLKLILTEQDRVYHIAIDILFMTGNSKLRYINCDYQNGKFDFNLSKNFIPNDHLRQASSDWFYDHDEYVKDSPILPRYRDRIRNKLPF